MHSVSKSLTWFRKLNLSLWWLKESSLILFCGINISRNPPMALGCLLNSWCVLFNRVKDKSGSRFVGDVLCLQWMTENWDVKQIAKKWIQAKMLGYNIWQILCVKKYKAHYQAYKNAPDSNSHWIYTRKKITVRSLIQLCGTDSFLEYPLNPWYFHERLDYRYRIEKSQVSTWNRDTQ